MLILNLVLIVAVVGVVLALLSWGIISSPTDEPTFTTAIRQPTSHPYARPHVGHPHWPDARRLVPASRRPVTD